MFLKAMRSVFPSRYSPVVALLLGASGAVLAETDWALHTAVQAGVDAWYLSSGKESDPLRNQLYMADSDTKGAFRPVSPWLTVHAHLRTGAQGEWVLRSRVQQGLGTSVDQFSYDHAISPSLGVRAGVLDYRATWCRSYDLDNPWVRETDPFCVNERVNMATASAPAVQTYVNFDWGVYRVQGVAGIYRPLAFAYRPREFSNLILNDTATVTKNHKQAVSINAINTDTATEWRLSWIGAQQSLFESAFVAVNDNFPRTQLNYHQKVDTIFAGVSWQITPRLRSRLTHLHSHLKARCELLNPDAGAPCKNAFNKSSTVLELNYQLNPQDVLTLAAAQYPTKQRDLYETDRQAYSLGWRRDWAAGWFSAVQLTSAHITIPYVKDGNRIPYPPGRSQVWGLGLRVGHDF